MLDQSAGARARCNRRGIPNQKDIVSKHKRRMRPLRRHTSIWSLRHKLFKFLRFYARGTHALPICVRQDVISRFVKGATKRDTLAHRGSQPNIMPKSIASCQTHAALLSNSDVDVCWYSSNPNGRPAQHKCLRVLVASKRGTTAWLAKP